MWSLSLLQPFVKGTFKGCFAEGEVSFVTEGCPSWRFLCFAPPCLDFSEVWYTVCFFFTGISLRLAALLKSRSSGCWRDILVVASVYTRLSDRFQLIFLSQVLDLQSAPFFAKVGWSLSPYSERCMRKDSSKCNLAKGRSPTCRLNRCRCSSWTVLSQREIPPCRLKTPFRLTRLWPVPEVTEQAPRKLLPCPLRKHWASPSWCRQSNWGAYSQFFFAGSCLGWSRAERPSVSWTEVLKTLCLQQPKEMFNIIKLCKNMQKATSTKVQTKFKQTSNLRCQEETQKGPLRIQRKAILPEWQCNRRKRALVKPEGSTYARVGICNQGKRALVKPEGSTYAGARSDQRIPWDRLWERVWTFHLAGGH